MLARSPIRLTLAAALSGLLWLSNALPAAAKQAGNASSSGSTTTTKKAPDSSKKQSTAHKKKRTTKRTAKKRGQKTIDSERAQQIQEALIREHYLSGEASGKWDDATQSAMRRYQADHGWQNKTVPDSRALIKLGLGPSTDGLLNPETAMTSSADPKPGAKTTLPAAPAQPAPSSEVTPRPQR